MLFKTQHRQIIVMIMLGLLVSTIFPFSVSAGAEKTKTPTIDGDLYDNSPYLRGWAEPDATVTFERSDGTYKWDTAKWDGEYMIYHATYRGAWILKAGEQLALSAQAPGKTVSDTVYIPVLPSVKTSKPTVTGNVYANGGWLSGTTEPGKLVYITLRNNSRSAVGGAWTETGSYTMQVKPSYPITAGEKLQLVAEAEGPGRRESDPVTVTVLPLKGKTAAPSVTKGVYERSLKGFSEQGSVVTIKRASGLESQVTSSREDGAFSADLNIDSYELGEKLKLTAVTYGKTVSDPVYAIVQPSPKSPVPTVSGNVYSNGPWISGSTEPNTRVFVRLKKADGTHILGDWTTNGSYCIKSLRTVPMEKLYVTAMADGKKESDPVPVTAIPTVGKTDAPTIIGHVDAVNGILTGKAEPGSEITINRPDYMLQSQPSSTDGSFSIDLHWHQLRVGEQLTVTAETVGKGISDEVPIIVQPAP
ncbi:Ig-like domain-containing protein [Paenibacillus elgii]|uniref:Ig-like domain-containing protein n=1 Tax=Paenibacillus elgii TaxID=189691 RepID=UPI000248CD7E|nr:Ig-like domain-containing protein [Paenibacillus elgii]